MHMHIYTFTYTYKYTYIYIHRYTYICIHKCDSQCDSQCEINTIISVYNDNIILKCDIGLQYQSFMDMFCDVISYSSSMVLVYEILLLF